MELEEVGRCRRLTTKNVPQKTKREDIDTRYKNLTLDDQKRELFTSSEDPNKHYQNAGGLPESDTCQVVGTCSRKEKPSRVKSQFH